MRHNAQRKIVVMDVQDLEDCGFDHQKYRHKLEAAGLGGNPLAWSPVMLVVNFAGGHTERSAKAGPLTEQYALKARELFEDMLAYLELGSQPFEHTDEKWRQGHDLYVDLGNGEVLNMNTEHVADLMLSMLKHANAIRAAVASRGYETVPLEEDNEKDD